MLLLKICLHHVGAAMLSGTNLHEGPGGGHLKKAKVCIFYLVRSDCLLLFLYECIGNVCYRCFFK